MGAKGFKLTLDYTGKINLLTISGRSRGGVRCRLFTRREKRTRRSEAGNLRILLYCHVLASARGGGGESYAFTSRLLAGGRALTMQGKDINQGEDNYR